LRVEPLRSRAVVIQFDAVAVRVPQVHRDCRPVVLRPVYGVCAIQELPHGAAELAAVGVEEGEVVEPRVTLWGWRPSLALPGVQAYVVVVPPEERKAALGRPKSGP
jgi:hypothetical protein